jgi:FixJ family two-component response regulator
MSRIRDRAGHVAPAVGVRAGGAGKADGQPKPMNDDEIREAIESGLAEEHELRTRHHHGPMDASDAVRLRELSESRDQCWDLLRQRRARREFGFDPNNVDARDPETLKHYRQ